MYYLLLYIEYYTQVLQDMSHIYVQFLGSIDQLYQLPLLVVGCIAAADITTIQQQLWLLSTYSTLRAYSVVTADNSISSNCSGTTSIDIMVIRRPKRHAQGYDIRIAVIQ
jgi:hypothetical protein